MYTPRILSEGNQSFDGRDQSRLNNDGRLSQQQAISWLERNAFSAPELESVMNGEIPPHIFLQQTFAKCPEELSSAARAMIVFIFSAFVMQGCAVSKAQVNSNNAIPDVTQVDKNNGIENPAKVTTVSDLDPSLQNVLVTEPSISMPVEEEQVVQPVAAVNQESDSDYKERFKNVCFLSGVQYERIKEKGWDECGDVIVEMEAPMDEKLRLQSMAAEVANAECWNICPDDRQMTNLRMAYLQLNGDVWTLKIRYHAQEQTATAKDKPEDRSSIFRELFRVIIKPVMNSP